MASVTCNGEVVGRLDCELARLHSQDQRLLALWAEWQGHGFRVLWPGPEPLPPGVACAVCVRVVQPDRDVMGLVVIELENRGYRVRFPADRQQD